MKVLDAGPTRILSPYTRSPFPSVSLVLVFRAFSPHPAFPHCSLLAMLRATVFALFTIFSLCSAQVPVPGTHTTPTNTYDRRHSTCSPGTYSPTSGNAPCYDCSPGSYSKGTYTITSDRHIITRQTKENGAKQCTSARAGYYVPTSGMKTEYSCDAGTYSGVAGSTSCSPCPPGHQCPNGALAKPQPCSPWPVLGRRERC